jgi:cell division protein FtsN
MKGARAAAGAPRRGAFVLGLVVGLLIGLVLALGVALYITKAPIPFVNKVPGRTAEQDSAEAERNRTWDPNAPLAGGKGAARPAAAGSAPPAATAPGARPPLAALPPSRAASPPGRDPAAILSGAPVPTPAASAPRSTAPGPDPFVYFVQAGAFTRNDEAEQQRAKLAMMGQSAKITEREQAGRVVYRVRMGPYPTRDAADALQVRLQDAGVESQIVRVEKQP